MSNKGCSRKFTPFPRIQEFCHLSLSVARELGCNWSFGKWPANRSDYKLALRFIAAIYWRGVGEKDKFSGTYCSIQRTSFIHLFFYYYFRVHGGSTISRSRDIVLRMLGKSPTFSPFSFFSVFIKQK